MRTTLATGLFVLLASSAAADAADTAGHAVTNRTNCQPQPDCQVNYPDLPPGRSSELRKGMEPSGHGSNAASSGSMSR